MLIVRRSPLADTQARALIDKGGDLTAILGAREPIRMGSMSGMVTQVTPANGGLAHQMPRTASLRSRGPTAGR